MNPGVIFDLDQTLIDTNSLEQLRSNRDWKTIYPLIAGLKAFDTVNDTIEQLNIQGIKVIIVTTSPRPYCLKIINHCGWHTDGQICFHDVTRRKPDAESFLKAISDFDLDINKTISVGDRDIDILASHSSGIPSIACTWASPDKVSLLLTNPTYVADSPIDMSKLLSEFFDY